MLLPYSVLFVCPWLRRRFDSATFLHSHESHSDSSRVQKRRFVLPNDPNQIWMFVFSVDQNSALLVQQKVTLVRIESCVFSQCEEITGKVTIRCRFFPRVAQTQKKKNIDLCPCPTSDEVPRLRLVTWKQERQFQRYRGCKWTKRAKALSLDTRVVQLVFLRSNQRMGWTAQS